MRVQPAAGVLRFAMALGAVVSFAGLAVQAAPPVPQGRKLMSQSEVMSELQCRANPTACLCGPGLYRHSFIGANRERYIECISAKGCGAGQVMHQVQSPGGRTTQECVAINAIPYREPVRAKAQGEH
jgi:hypothetical protein